MQAASSPLAAKGFMFAGIAAFLAIIGFTVYRITALTPGSDSSKDIADAIKNVGFINAILVLVLAGTAYFYVAAEPMAERPYIMIMLHVSLLISLISVSISSLQVLNTAPPA